MDYKSTLNLPKTEFPHEGQPPPAGTTSCLAWWEQEQLYEKIQAVT